VLGLEENTNGADLKACAVVVTLYTQNIKLTGEIGHAFELYIPLRISDSASEAEAYGFDRISRADSKAGG
jgi:hypothetical protein